MIVPDGIPGLIPPDPALAAAGAALAAQGAALAVTLARLEIARAQVPAAHSGDSWRGLAQSAFAASVHELGAGIDEAMHAVRAAQQHTGRAVSTISARMG